MQFKYLQTIQEAQDQDFKIVSTCWSPNNQKFAVATSDRFVSLYDEKGNKKDKFSTKPADPEAGKKSYVIASIAFSPESNKIAVAQSDCIVYVYKIGDKWGDKKVISNKFPQSASVTCMIWLLSGYIICGLADGKVRAFTTKSNKAHTLFAADSMVISLASNPKGTGFISGHIDGNIIRFFITNDPDNKEENLGRAALHPVPPFGLAWPYGYIFAAGCDKRVCIYNNAGKSVKTFDYSKDEGEHEFLMATSSPSGQAVVLASFGRLRMYIWKTRQSLWAEATSKVLDNFYTVTSLAWKRDGSKITCSGFAGVIMMFETVLKRTVWRNKFEITYVGPSQVLVKPVDNSDEGVVVKSHIGAEIDDIKIMGKDSYLVAKTNETLIVADLRRKILSEVPWSNPEESEKFYFENSNVCMIFNFSELSLIEYGNNEILCSVRTDFVNPHLISVRLNERNNTTDNKKMAYLLDLKTILVLDLIHSIPLCEITHDVKIDWLELSETAEKLLFRDKKERLTLVDIATKSKQIIHSDVTFVQWVERSNVAVAQSGNMLVVWYNIEVPDIPTVTFVKGEVTDVVRADGKTKAVCVDGSNVYLEELDESLVEFGTALNDNDYSRAVLYLENIGRTSDSDAMWQTLLEVGMRQQNLALIERCYKALGDPASAHYLQSIIQSNKDLIENTEDPTSLPRLWADLSILYENLGAAETIFVEQGEVNTAIDIFKKLHRWNDALRLAEQRQPEALGPLRGEYMKILAENDQLDKLGQLLEKEGKYDQALELYLKSDKLLKVPRILLDNSSITSNQTLVASVLKTLLKKELYEAAADIYMKMDKFNQALDCYRKGKLWEKALDIARQISPDLIIELEEEWGDHLVEIRHMDAAINHFIEAGSSVKALEAAIGAKQWKKALHIIKVVDDEQVIQKYCQILAQHFESVKDYVTAEKLYISCGLYRHVIDMYNEAGLWDKALNMARTHLDSDEISKMYNIRAEKLEEEGKFKDAEKLYLSVDLPDLAIAMYKRAEKYDNMIRLVERYHPNLLQTTHLHLGQQLEGQEKYRAAEIQYLAAGEWSAAMNMYRGLNMWEEAYRVAKQNGGASAANQVAFLWSRTLSIESAIKLLNKYGILELCVDYACETYQFEFAFQLAKNLPNKLPEVHYKYAKVLEEDGKFIEAETEFVSAGQIKEAVLMYLNVQDWIAALRVAETYDASLIPDVLQTEADQCFKNRRFNDFEVLLLKAQAPEVIVQKYKSADMWVDALRVCKDYLPHMYPALQSEYSLSHHNTNTDADIGMLLSKANEWALAGKHKQAVHCLLQVNSSITEPTIVKRALLRAADMVNKFMFGEDALEVIQLLSPRLNDIGEYTAAAKLYISAELMKEAIDTFIQFEDWDKAKKVAKEFEPAYESYVESKYKDRLLKRGDVEQLADIDIIGALDLLAEQGQWIRCIEKAKLHNVAPILHKYVALYAAKLIQDNLITKALDLFSTYGAPAMTQNLNIYSHLAIEMFGLPQMDQADSYRIWEQLRQMLLEINEGMEEARNMDMDTKLYFRNLLLISHYFALRCACRQSHSLKSIAVKLSVSLLRYTDLIPADKAFYEAGKDMKDEGRLSEAFVFLNHYLDLCEAIEEGEGQLIDHSDLVHTDFPSNIPIPTRMFLTDDVKEHDTVREWVLAVSMDQKVDQTLPVDDRMLYESSLQPGESPCLVTGYPIRNHAVSFSNSNMQAIKEAYSKLNMAIKISPDSNVPSVISFIHKWCGSPTS